MISGRRLPLTLTLSPLAGRGDECASCVSLLCLEMGNKRPAEWRGAILARSGVPCL